MEFHLFEARRGDSVVGNGGSAGFFSLLLYRGPEGWGEYPTPYCDGHKSPVR